MADQPAMAWCSGTGSLAWVGEIWINIALAHVWYWGCGRDHQQGSQCLKESRCLCRQEEGHRYWCVWSILPLGLRSLQEVSCHSHLSAPLGASGRLLSTGNRSLRGQLLHVTGAVPIGKWGTASTASGSVDGSATAPWVAAKQCQTPDESSASRPSLTPAACHR